jgi:steroid delta-isomerase-like uncharacterized protein
VRYSEAAFTKMMSERSALVIPVNTEAPRAEEAAVGTDENKALVRRFVAEAINGLRPEAIDELVSDGYTYHAPGMEIQGRNAIAGVFAMLRAAFPDWHEEIEDLIAEGDRVVFRVTGRGTHRGDFQGVPPSGRAVTVAGTDIVRIEEGKLAEHWANFDQLGLMTQIGALPDPGAART